MRIRIVAPLLACLALAAPASASAHARTPTVALDYRLALDHALPGVDVSILDGDRDLRIAANGHRVVVLGDLSEPMLRIDGSGAWANRASVTAAAEKLVHTGHGWQRVGGSTFAWHDHRLAPPPYAATAHVVAHFRIPVRVDGRAAAVAGTFVRYRRPAFWPWLAAGAIAVVAAAVAGRNVRRRRDRVTIALGGAAGIAAVASLAAFGAADSPTGGVAWVQPALAGFVAVAAASALVRLDGERRVLLAALIGAAAAATTLGSLGVFRHAVVVSAFPGWLARAVCAVAFTAGAAAAAIGLQHTNPKGAR